jgi:hypothetical protein
MQSLHLKHASASTAPRVRLEDGNWFRLEKDVFMAAVEKDGTRPHEYYLLPGLLYRFFRIYCIFPPNDSWIWKYFPHGNLWQSRINGALSSANLDESLIW